MRTLLMILCIVGQLFYWDLLLKVLQTLSRPLARRHLDRHVSGMAHRLLVLAKHYGGLTVDLDPRLITDVPSPTLVCSNHQSLADIVVLLDALARHRLRFVAKRSLSHGFPAVSEVLRIQRHALISRTSDFRRGSAELRRIGDETVHGISPVVFPEGTRSRTGHVKEFHPGGVRMILARRSIPISAVAVDGGHYFVSFKDLAKGLSHITYRAAFVGVYEHDGSKQGIVDALARAQRAVSERIEAWRAADATGAGYRGSE
ncbi:MAG: lysophospholipid acyltransferase family protein [Spirochaetota bacterium]